ncbi:MAG: hydroxymethylglutaryl-CoA reductase (NADPH) [Methanopyri archaeon]|jgi:hydroxymethylglutaryl-CoA reductase (NADPH)|nr:hydroxymethylglutaryl-CoA reductase (NADPH) [Methanopyri archaeon]
MDDSELIKKVATGEVRLHQVEGLVDGDIDRATEIRRVALEQAIGVSLENLGSSAIEMSITRARNVENPIGWTQIPTGIAGPIKVTGEYADGNYYLPMATTEGALLASVARGCSAISKSGGAKARVLRSLMTRAPVMKVPDTDHAVQLKRWIEANFDKVAAAFKGDEPFVWLRELKIWIVGRNVFIRFLADPADAMGMNMISKGSRSACDFISEHNPYAVLIATSGNLCVDKKPSAMNWIEGRGKTVQADVILPREIVQKMFKCTPEALSDVAYRKLYIGGAQAAAYGFNAHVANIIAALFIATGQDPAQVVESSMSMVTAEVTDEGDLYASITLPSLEVATLGGGTGLPTQLEAQNILGCSGPNTKDPGANAKKIAEIFAAAALAGELSLLGALAAGHLVTAHERLGRGNVAKE